MTLEEIYANIGKDDITKEVRRNVFRDYVNRIIDYEIWQQRKIGLEVKDTRKIREMVLDRLMRAYDENVRLLQRDKGQI